MPTRSCPLSMYLLLFQFLAIRESISPSSSFFFFSTCRVYIEYYKIWLHLCNTLSGVLYLDIGLLYISRYCPNANIANDAAAAAAARVCATSRGAAQRQHVVASPFRSSPSAAAGLFASCSRDAAHQQSQATAAHSILLCSERHASGPAARHAATSVGSSWCSAQQHAGRRLSRSWRRRALRVC